MKKLLIVLVSLFGILQAQGLSQDIANLTELRDKVITISGSCNAISDDIGDAVQTLILLSEQYCMPVDFTTLPDSTTFGITTITGVQNWLVDYKVIVGQNIEGMLFTPTCVALVKADFVNSLINKYQSSILEAAYYN